MNVPFYRKKFDEIRFNPDDLRKLPFMTKNDLRDNYPYGLFAVLLREVVRVHASPGTTGMFHGRRVFAERHQDLVEPRGTHSHGRRDHKGRRDPDRLQLWALYRRLRPPLRRRAHSAPRSSRSQEAIPNQIVIERKGALDETTVNVEVSRYPNRSFSMK